MGAGMMPKVIAILNVVAWGGFWAFGYLAFAGDNAALALTLAALGGGVGMACYIWLARHAQARGLVPQERVAAHDMPVAGETREER